MLLLERSAVPILRLAVVKVSATAFHAQFGPSNADSGFFFNANISAGRGLV